MPKVVVEECSSVLSRASSEPAPKSSKSPGVLECLQRCASALALADQRMDSLAVVARKVSGGGSLEKLAMPGRTRQCHGCHGPCDESHRGYKTGAERCPLVHHDGCEGGIREGYDNQNQKWRACPRGYVCIEDDLSDEADDFGSNGFMEDGILGEQCMLSNVPAEDLSLRGAAARDVSSLGSGFSVLAGATTVTATTSSLTAASTSVTASGIGSTMVTTEAEAVSTQVTAARHRLSMLKKQREDLEILAELQKEEEREAAQNKKLQEQLSKVSETKDWGCCC